MDIYIGASATDGDENWGVSTDGQSAWRVFVEYGTMCVNGFLRAGSVPPRWWLHMMVHAWGVAVVLKNSVSGARSSSLVRWLYKMRNDVSVWHIVANCLANSCKNCLAWQTVCKQLALFGEQFCLSRLPLGFHTVWQTVEAICVFCMNCLLTSVHTI